MTVHRLILNDFAAFGTADFEFSPGLNVLIGANGTGKSHALKVLYSILRPLARTDAEVGRPVVEEDRRLVWDKISAVLRPERTSPSELGEVAHRSLTRHGANGFYVVARGDFGDIPFSNKANVPDLFAMWRRPSGPIVFIPSAEVLSVYPGFVSAYERRELSFDETFRDLCVDSLWGPTSVRLAALDEGGGGIR